MIWKDRQRIALGFNKEDKITYPKMLRLFVTEDLVTVKVVTHITALVRRCWTLRRICGKILISYGTLGTREDVGRGIFLELDLKDRRGTSGWLNH